MPALVGQWLENGYFVQEAYTSLLGSRMLEPGDTTGCNLVNGDLELYAIIENFGTDTQSFEQCYVTRLTLSPEALQAIVNDYEYTQDKNEYFTSITIPISECANTAFYIDTASGVLGMVEYINYPE